MSEEVSQLGPNQEQAPVLSVEPLSALGSGSI